jgi:hypothetical protein
VEHRVHAVAVRVANLFTLGLNPPNGLDQQAFVNIDS